MSEKINLADPTIAANITVELLKQAHELMTQSFKVVPNANSDKHLEIHYDEIINYIYDGRFVMASKKLRDFYRTWFLQ